MDEPITKTEVHVDSKRFASFGNNMDRVLLQQLQPDNEETTSVISGSSHSAQEKEEIQQDLQEEDDPENNYQQVMCKHCVIRDMVGCDHCGLFIYGFKHKQFKIKVTKIS